jgi:hypothetical protein
MRLGILRMAMVAESQNVKEFRFLSHRSGSRTVWLAERDRLRIFYVFVMMIDKKPLFMKPTYRSTQNYSLF